MASIMYRGEEIRNTRRRTQPYAITMCWRDSMGAVHKTGLLCIVNAAHSREALEAACADADVQYRVRKNGSPVIVVQELERAMDGLPEDVVRAKLNASTPTCPLPIVSGKGVPVPYVVLYV